MTSKTVFFGTRNLMMRIPAPKLGVTKQHTGFSSVIEHFDGTAHVRRSDGGRKEVSLEWNLAPAENIDPIVSFYNGDYGTDGIYYLDPFSAETNAAPDHWASPWKAATDGVNLAGEGQPRPQRTSTPPAWVSDYRYPYLSALYDLDYPDEPVRLWVPNPSGHTVHVGVHGTQVSGDAGVFGGSSKIPFLSSSSDQLVSWTSTDPWVELYLGGQGGFLLTSVVVLVLPTGVSPRTGNWMPGQGYDRLAFSQPLEENDYSASLNLRSVTARLVEDIGS